MMKKTTPRSIRIAPSEGVIVFKHTGIEFMPPEPMSGAPVEMRDTMDFLKYAIHRKDWIAAWWEEEELLEALDDLTEEDEEKNDLPQLTLLEGGLAQKNNEN